ncbi:unnamed protein product [Parascedosporium putredinis]|uniref:DNA polymerase epsilon subunit D n=1 Tax=Parascedosporium putredinis TaxID=1442378 RepID=A0A9P1H6K4_9PEZI|nr:unnamed protein product [Parascedosporium putredinis]CAI7997695.1 unnamed protein product [Parascedosporium putredinis]
MPRKSEGGRKSDVAVRPAPKPAPVAEPQNGSGSASESEASTELNLPKSIITRLAKGVLPPHVQLQGNAVLALRQSATVFISYIASHANEHAQSAGKKTVLPADVFQALEDTEFGFLRGQLEAEFAKFNQTQAAKRSNYRQKQAAKRAAVDTSTLSAVEGDISTNLDPDTTIASDTARSAEADDAETEPEEDAEEDENDEEEEDEEEDDEDDDEDDEEEEEDGDEDEEVGVLEDREDLDNDDEDDEAEDSD